MKKYVLAMLIAGIAISNCSSVFAEGLKESPDFSIYSNKSLAGSSFGTYALTQRGHKEGASTCKSYAGFVKLGKCGIGESMKNGNLAVLKYVDIYKNGWFFARTTTIKAYGD